MIGLFLLLAQLALADTRWATADAEGVRWPDVTVVTVKLAAGDEVEVLAQTGDKVRVRKGVDFGWVPAASLSAVAPALPEAEGEEGAPAELPGFTVTPTAPAPTTPAPTTPAPTNPAVPAPPATPPK